LELINYRYGKYDLVYPKSYYQFLNEAFILDVYRASLLKKDDLVLDLGAGAGDFCIIASNKIGQQGKIVALEPHKEDFDILERNIDKNRCRNIIPVNLGVGDKPEEKEISFWGKTFKSKIDTVENVLERLSISKDVNFIKMDIEGAEIQVVNKSIEIFKRARVISLEFHPLYDSTRKKMDEILLPHGFTFIPLTMNYIYRRILKNFIFHPFASYRSAIRFLKENKRSSQKIITGFDWLCGMGTYVKR
jgi:FkbM family methyltransferase